MKKKFTAMIMTACMAAALLTACGDTSEANAPVSSASAPEQSVAADSADGNMVSDETFGILQENWAALTDFYNQAAMAYNEATSNGELERDDNFENLMNQAADILEQIQYVSQTELTQEDAVELNDTMIAIQEQMSEALGVNLTE